MARDPGLGAKVSACCPTCGSRYATWTPAALVAAGRAWFEANGRNPGSEDWARATPAHPSKRTVYRHFKDWPAFLKACGLTARVPWTRDLVILAFTRYRFEHGRMPRSADWVVAHEGYPSRYTVRNLFGSFNAGVVAAGYEPRMMRRSMQGYANQAGAVGKRRASTTGRFSASKVSNLGVALVPSRESEPLLIPALGCGTGVTGCPPSLSLSTQVDSAAAQDFRESDAAARNGV